MTTTTELAKITPQQWRGARPTSWETAWNEALEEARPHLPDQVRRHLEEAALGRAIGAYDYGYAVGIGELPLVDMGSPEVVLESIGTAIERLSAAVAALRARM